MRPPHSELHAFALKVWGEHLDGAGAFADWLEERGDPRGVLLRRRWKRWRKERAEAAAADDAIEQAAAKPWVDLVRTVQQSGGEASITVRLDRRNTDDCDRAFRRYFREKFPESYPPLHDDA
jgi:hypothetical protein